jgi:hypothetical protein
MIESIMYFGIGFFAAGLCVLVVVPLVHGRAVRLTTRRLEGAIPSSMAEVLADKDLQRAEFALSTRRLEIKLEELNNNKASQLAELGRKADAINRLGIELGALRDQLRTGEQNATARAASEAERALSEKQSELATLTRTLEERSLLTDSQNAAIAVLTTEMQMLQEQLATAANQIGAVEQQCEAERVSSKVVSDQLSEERAKFTEFHDRVAELVRQLIAQTSKDQLRSQHTEQDLQRRLIEQSRLLEDGERDRENLRSEIEIVRQAEHDLRATAADIGRRAIAAVEHFKLENTRLEGALDRANCDRARIAYELANSKRQANDSRAA